VLEDVEELKRERKSGRLVLDISRVPSEPEMMMTGEDVQRARGTI
jgi:hypothetical protein